MEHMGKFLDGQNFRISELIFLRELHLDDSNEIGSEVFVRFVPWGPREKSPV